MGLKQDCGLSFYRKWPTGFRNKITDVPGVTVGHVTLKNAERKINTGVTAILPHGGNLFQEKVMAGVSVINGFGKSLGLLQIEELGTIETPILMTNTLSVGTAATALAKYMLKQNPDIGIKTGTVNCLVTECNDSRLNDIRGFHVREGHIFQAIDHASEDFEEGAVGAGTGMCCMGMKGGIGSASRIIAADGAEYAAGAVVMTNFGSSGNLIVSGDPIGRRIAACGEMTKDQGSIIIVIATNLPLSERQLKRVAKRASIALGRTGSWLGNGSGDIAIAFTTANNRCHYSDKDILDMRMFYDENIDCVFEAAAEAVEESIISALYHADTAAAGFRIPVVRGLREYMEGL